MVAWVSAAGRDGLCDCQALLVMKMIYSIIDLGLKAPQDSV